MKMELDIYDYLAVGEQTAREAGKILLDYLGKIHVREKGRADLVTEADFASQEKVKEMLLAAFPTHGILGEEDIPGTSAKGGPDVYRWIVDPLDGTTNYVHTFPNFAVSLALEFDSEMQVGIIYAPMTQECFTAVRGGGAFLNGKPIRTSGETGVEKSLVAVGFPPGASSVSPDVRAFMNVLPCVHAIRRTGSTAMNLAFTACGRLDASWNFGTKPWDVAAGTLLVREAGGSVRNIYGGPFCVDDGHFLAAGTECLQENFQKLIRE